MQVGVEHDDGEGEHEDRLAVPQLGHDVPVALAVALGEHLHQPLDLLRLAGQAEVGLVLAQGHVHLHARQVYLLRKHSKKNCLKTNVSKKKKKNSLNTNVSTFQRNEENIETVLANQEQKIKNEIVVLDKFQYNNM